MSRCLCNVRYDQIKPLQNQHDFNEELQALFQNISYMEHANTFCFLDLQYQYAQTRLDLMRDYLEHCLKDKNHE